MNKDVLEHIEDTVRDIMPLDARILLFGSRARGDARPDSDWDILIILNKNKRTVQDINDLSPQNYKEKLKKQRKREKNLSLAPF